MTDIGRLRVLLLSTHPVQYAVPLYRRYAELGVVELDVAFLSENGLGEGAFDAGYSREISWDIDLTSGYPHRRLRNCGRSSWPRFLHYINPSILTLLRSRNYDVVVNASGYWHLTSWMSLVGARLFRTKWTFTTDAVEFEGPRRLQWPEALAKRVFLRGLMSVSDGVFVASNASGKYMRQFGQRKQIAKFAYVADSKRFCCDDDRPTHSSQIRATYVGRLVEHKRVADLIEALALVEGWSLTIAGDGPERDSLAVLAERLGVATRVRFAGFVNQSDLPSLYAKTDVLLLPSEFEPFGIVVHEAGLSGVPSIVSSRCVGVIDELVIDGESGLVFQMGQPSSLADRLRALIDDPDLLARLRTGAKAVSMDRTIESQASEFADGVRAIVSGLNP